MAICLIVVSHRQRATKIPSVSTNAAEKVGIGNADTVDGIALVTDIGSASPTYRPKINTHTMVIIRLGQDVSPHPAGPDTTGGDSAFSIRITKCDTSSREVAEISFAAQGDIHPD